MNAVCLVLVILFVDETYYDRSIPQDQQPIRKSRLARLIGIEQWKSRHQRISFAQACMRPVFTILKLPVLLATVYYIFTFAWVIGLNAATAVFLETTYKFGPNESGESAPMLLIKQPAPYSTHQTNMV